MEILIAFIIMFSIALVAGILLSVFSHCFSVEENPLKIKIRECLPGINCGACGYKGCDDYAEALACGDVNPSLCIPGAQTSADKIAEIKGVKPEPLKSVIAFVACNGNCNATFKKAVYEGVSSCKAGNMLFGGENACSYACLGIGDCAAVCPSEAICIANGIAHVNPSRCIGCGLCAETCPKHIINMVPQSAATVVMCSNKQKGADARKVCNNACIGCKKCEKTCPHNAITVNNNLAVIDYSKCTDCGECATVCPTGCLKKASFSKAV